MNNNINNCIDLIIDDLVGMQKNQQIYYSISSSSQDELTRERKYQSVFVPALILLNLSEVDYPKLQSLREEIISFLLIEKSNDWSYNYWVKKSSEEKNMRLPDDLDDTFVVLAALQKNGYKFTAKDYAKITNLLVVCEDKVGGPYRTWLVGEVKDKRWLEVDVAVNVNIAYFLFLNEINLPKLDKYLVKLITSKNLESKYYPNLFSVGYFLSRFLRGKNREKLVKLLLKRYLEKGFKKNCLNVSLVISALINLGYRGLEVEEGVKYLLDEHKKGGWQWAGFCLDPMIGKEKYYNGSQALTYSFCLQAICLYQKMTELNQRVKYESGGKKESEYCRKIYKDAMTRTENLSQNLKGDGKDYLKKYLIKDEDGEIVLLPVIMAKNAKRKIDDKVVQKLSLANLYGWMAYTIYDDFLDDEGEKKYLSLANLWMRELVEIYRGLKIEGLNDYFDNLLDEMEGANNWEVNNCRFNPKKQFKLNDIPDFDQWENLASKSIGHSLSGVAILLSQKADKKIVERYLALFRNYLIVRQLNDDAHDWEDDLRRGQINAVGAMVLRDWKNAKQNKEVEIPRDLERMQVIFWEKTIKKISRLIFTKADLTKKMIADLQSDLDLSFLNKKLDNLKGAARRAVEESREAREFMEGF